MLLERCSTEKDSRTFGYDYPILHRPSRFNSSSVASLSHSSYIAGSNLKIQQNAKDKLMSPPPPHIVETLSVHVQSHLLQWWDELSSAEQQQLVSEIEAVDFDLIESVIAESESSGTTHSDVVRADVAVAPQSVVRQPATAEDAAKWAAAADVGSQLLAEGKVAVITVAGGQGSRLGFDHPKGMYPIGPVTERTLFQIFAEQIQARRNTANARIPWLIMTSSATHEETVTFFEANNFFGLEHGSVQFFQQGSMPAVDAATGKLLMESRHQLCLSPDGHGGLVTALQSSGLLQHLADQSIEHIFYHQVDNPTVIICDPALLGLHQQHQSQLTTNVVRKISATEKMGVLADVNGRLEIIEYSELNEAQANRTDESGEWIFWAGNTAIHVFTRKFFEALASDGCQLELHLASKKVPHLDNSGATVTPTEPNAVKLERFIFDALPLAERALVVEGNREREFNPVKNADGSDSPATSRAALESIYTEWLTASGHSVPPGKSVEISPLVAMDAQQLARRLASGEMKLDDLLH